MCIRDRLDAAAAKNYNELCERHKTDYNQLFGRVKLQLNPHAPMTLQYHAVTDLPTHQRLARYRKMCIRDSLDRQHGVMYPFHHRYHSPST